MHLHILARNRVFTVIILLSSLLSLAACSLEKGGTGLSPDVPGISTTGGGGVSLLSLVQGTWTGTETATVGLGGPISVTFTQPPTLDANIAGNITVTLSTGTFHGTFSGTVADMLITATDGPAGSCSYIAHGVLNGAGTQITGTYSGSGTGTCPTKAGTFVLNGQSAVDACPNIDGYQATVPAGMVKNELGNCVPIVPPLNCVDQFWQMNQGNDNAAQNACLNRGGIWRGNGYDIPVDNVGTLYNKVCEFTPNPPGSPGQDLTLIFEKAIVCPVAPASLR